MTVQATIPQAPVGEEDTNSCLLLAEGTEAPVAVAFCGKGSHAHFLALPVGPL